MLEARQRLQALVIPKRQALTRLQGLLAPLLRVAEMTFPQQLKTSIFRLFGYIPKQPEDAFLREIKVLEARQRLQALVIPKRQALTRHQALLAP